MGLPIRTLSWSTFAAVFLRLAEAHFCLQNTRRGASRASIRCHISGKISARSHALVPFRSRECREERDSVLLISKALQNYDCSPAKSGNIIRQAKMRSDKVAGYQMRQVNRGHHS